MLDVGAVRFGGKTFKEERDGARLRGLLGRVFDLMSDGRPRTLGLIAWETGGSEASVSARLRDLRKPKYGGHTVEKACIGPGLWIYTLKLGEWWLP